MAARAAALAALAVLLAAGVARVRQGVAVAARRNQLGMLRLETAPDASADWFQVLSRAPGGCSFEQGVRAGTPGFRPEYPGAPPPHRHKRSNETFTVVQGRMGYWVDGAVGSIGPGDGSVTIPAGAPHFFFNADEAQARRGPPTGSPPLGDLVVRFSLSPCGSHPEFFENLAGASADAGGRGRVAPLQLLLLCHAHGVELAVVPWAAWRAAAPAAAALARLLGYKSVYPEYSPSLGGMPV